MKYLISILIFILLSCDEKTKSSNQPTHKVTSLVTDDSIPNKNDEPVVETIDIDSNKINELKKLVLEKNDEYRQITWISPKSKPKYRNSNAIYCYFKKDTNNRVSNFRFVIQYYASDWLFIRYYRFLIDGKSYIFTPSDIETDNGYGGYIWEWCDSPITTSDSDLIKALANCKSAKIKFEGSQYYDEKTISPKQLKDINTIYTLYIAMGGSL